MAIKNQNVSQEETREREIKELQPYTLFQNIQYSLLHPPVSRRYTNNNNKQDQLWITDDQSYELK